MAKYESSEMVWTSQDLNHEWLRFYRQASCISDDPLHDKELEENFKISYLKMWVGDKVLDVFKGFQFAKPEDAAKLEVVVKKYEEYCAPHKKHVHIMAALKLNERRQADSESFDSFVTDLNILPKDCGHKERKEWFLTQLCFVVSKVKFVKSASI